MNWFKKTSTLRPATNCIRGFRTMFNTRFIKIIQICFRVVILEQQQSLNMKIVNWSPFIQTSICLRMYRASCLGLTMSFFADNPKGTCSYVLIFGWQSANEKKLSGTKSHRNIFITFTARPSWISCCTWRLRKRRLRCRIRSMSNFCHVVSITWKNVDKSVDYYCLLVIC